MSTSSSEDHTNAITTTMSTVIHDHTDVVTNTMSTASLETNAETTTMSTTSYNHTDVVNTTVTISTIPDMTSTIVLTTLATVTNIEPIPYYAVGILAVLVLGVGALAVLMLIFYVHKNQKEKNLRNSEPIVHHLHMHERNSVLLTLILAYT